MEGSCEGFLLFKGSPFFTTFEKKLLGHGQALASEWWQIYLKGQTFVAVGHAHLCACVCVYVFFFLFKARIKVNQ